MFFTEIRLAIGLQRLVAVVLVIILASSQMSHQFGTAQHESFSEFASDIRLFCMLLVWWIVMASTGYLLTQGPHKQRSKWGSCLMIIVWLMFWFTATGRLVLPTTGWLPIRQNALQLAWWFCLFLPVELAVLEIVLPVGKPPSKDDFCQEGYEYP